MSLLVPDAGGLFPYLAMALSTAALQRCIKVANSGSIRPNSFDFCKTDNGESR
jgi:hypothetical protein